jgi:hypothetical protein
MNDDPMEKPSTTWFFEYGGGGGGEEEVGFKSVHYGFTTFIHDEVEEDQKSCLD